jgi:phenylalanine ammonia-lyase
MTVITSELRQLRRSSVISTEPLVRDVKDGVAILATYPDEVIYSRPVPTRSSSRLIPRKPQQTTLLDEFLQSYKELEFYKYVSTVILCWSHLLTMILRNGKPVVVDGQNLSIAAVTAAARYQAPVSLDASHSIKNRIAKSRKVIVDKIDAGLSVYGVSTGFGGSADTRTDEPILLGNALLQHQHAGVLPSSTNKPLEVLPLQDPLSSTSMPEAWVRGAILIRMNSLIRGHSGVRWELIEKMNQLLRANIIPLVPLRGTISASGGDTDSLSFFVCLF